MRKELNEKFESYPIIKDVLKWDFMDEDLDRFVFYPWGHVLESKYLDTDTFHDMRMLEHVSKCDKCKKDEHIRWVYFHSPPKTWEMLCGRAGYISICIKCKRQTHFIPTVVS